MKTLFLFLSFLLVSSMSLNFSDSHNIHVHITPPPGISGDDVTYTIDVWNSVDGSWERASEIRVTNHAGLVIVLANVTPGIGFIRVVCRNSFGVGEPSPSVSYNNVEGDCHVYVQPGRPPLS